MSDPIKRFEQSLLRPLWGAFAFLTVVAVFNSRWGWAAGGAVAEFYVCIVGALLHPTLTAAQLAQGPLTSEAAVREARTMPLSVKCAIAVRGCRQIAFLMGVLMVPFAICAYRLPWYLALPVAAAVGTFLGFTLPCGFREGAAPSGRDCS